MSFEDKERIKISVRRIADAFARKLPDSGVETWALRLLPHVGPTLWRVLSDACTWETFPTLGVLLNKLHAEIGAARVPVYVSKTVERASQETAMKTMAYMWLVQHLELGNTEGVREAIKRHGWTKESLIEWMKSCG